MTNARRVGGSIAIAGAAALVVVLAAHCRARPAPRAGSPRSGLSTTVDGARADPHRLAPGSIGGTVRDPAGAAIAGARVCAAPQTDVFAPDPTCAVSGGDGRYQLDDLPAADYAVTAMARSYVIDTFHPGGDLTAGWFPLAPGEHRAGIDIVLRHGGAELSGTVRDLGGGTIAHARVRANGWWTGAIMAETDDHGRFALWVHAGTLTLDVVADGYAVGSRFVEAPTEIDIALVPESSLGGTVVDATGAPVAGAEVYAGEGWFGPGAGVEIQTTDARGRFRITGLPPGRYLAIAHTARGYGHSDGTTLLGLGERVDDVVVRLAPAYQVVGRVAVTGGAACDDASVSLVNAAGTRMFASASGADAATGGSVRVDGVLPGTYTATPWCRGALAAASYAPVVVTDRDVTGLTWSVTTGAVLTGHVRTAGGAPREGVHVMAAKVGGPPREPDCSVGARTTADGAFRLIGLRGGHYELYATEPSAAFGPPRVELDVAAGAALERDIVLSDVGAVAVRVVDLSGAAAGGVQVMATSRTGDRMGAPTDAAGQLVIAGLAVGDAEVVAVEYGIVNEPNPISATQTVAIAADHQAAATLVVAARTGAIRGTVVDANGAAIADAFIASARERDADASIADTRWSDDRVVLAGVDGRFAITGLATGSYTLRAYRQGGGEAIAAHVATGATGVTLTIAATGTVDGVVRQAGRPVDALQVDVLAPAVQLRRSEEFLAAGGRFVLRDLPAGHYLLTVGGAGAQRTIEVDLAAGATQHVTVELDRVVALRGRLVDVHRHTGVPGVSMSAQLISGATIASLGQTDLANVTDDTGAFTITGAPRGTLAIRGFSIDDLDRRGSIVELRTIAPDAGDAVDIGEVGVAVRTTDALGIAGVLFRVVTDDTPTADRTATVTMVDPEGPAGVAGIVVGDVVTALDGFAITPDNAGNVSELLAGSPGTPIAVTLARGPTVTVVLAPLGR